MRVVVFGASGNVGTSLLDGLAAHDQVESVLGVARRRVDLDVPKVEWAQADIASSDLAPLVRGADAVVHLAWLLQPSRDHERLRRVNVDGSARVFRAVGEAGVPALVYASSVGAYSPGPKDRRVDEWWPVGGVGTSFYGRRKAAVESLFGGRRAARADLRPARPRRRGHAAARLRRARAVARRGARHRRRRPRAPLTVS